MCMFVRKGVDVCRFRKRGTYTEPGRPYIHIYLTYLVGRYLHELCIMHTLGLICAVTTSLPPLGLVRYIHSTYLSDVYGKVW